MTLKNLARSAVVVSAALTLAACVRFSEPDAARVDCGTPGPGGVACKVQRTAGQRGFQACWDLVISCRNEGQMTGSICHKVASGENEANATMPVSSFSNQASCDVPTSGKVERLKLTTL